MLTASLIPTVIAAAREAQQKLVVVAAATPGLFKDAKASDLSFTAGSVHHKDQPAASGTPFDKVIAAAKTSSVSGQGRSKGTISDMIGVTKPSFSSQSYAAHFVEVTWEPEIARLRLSRIVTTVDAGRIINELTGRNQIEGAVAMGIGMALFEELVHDPRSGAPINSNLADYILTTHADAPPHEVVFLQHPDLHLNELGARGIGEIGLAGIRCGDHLRHPPRHRRARARAACPGRGSAAIAGHLSRAAGRVGGTMQARPATTRWRCRAPGAASDFVKAGLTDEFKKQRGVRLATARGHSMPRAPVAYQRGERALFDAVPPSPVQNVAAAHRKSATGFSGTPLDRTRSRVRPALKPVMSSAYFTK
jgi:hypothetical protein